VNPTVEGGTMGKKWPRNFAESDEYVLLVHYIFFQNQLDQSVPMLVLLFPQSRTEQQTGNVANAQNGCARTTLL
jgi:hypothetical protein